MRGIALAILTAGLFVGKAIERRDSLQDDLAMFGFILGTIIVIAMGV